MFKGINNGVSNDFVTNNHIKAKLSEMEPIICTEVTKRRVVDKSQFSLPSVKELAKQFTKEDKEPQPIKNGTQSKNFQKTQHNTANKLPEKEPELDYSSVPVSKIIVNLQQAAENPKKENHQKPVIYDSTQPSTRMEILRKVDGHFAIDHSGETNGKAEKQEISRFNGKNVHSLTARSISKEFREGLKNCSYQKKCHKIDKISSSGESDQDLISSRTETPPTPSIDLKNVKKFWEEIITSNSNTTKQK